MLNAVRGSTNGILHWLSLSNESGIKLTYDCFERIGKKAPHVSDLKPGWNYLMDCLDQIGYIPFVI